MEDIMTKNTKVAGPEHPSFVLGRAWYTFGVFSPDGSIKRFMLVEASNGHAVHMIESLVQQDGSVSATCGLVLVSEEKPQMRSTTVQEVAYVHFIIDMVEADRWLDSPFLIGLFQHSLSGAEKVAASLKIDEAIREHQWRQQHEQPAEIESTEEAAELTGPAPAVDEMKLDQLHAGLVGLGFAKRDVQNFVASVRDRTESVEELLMEGIKKLNRGLS